MNDVGLVVLIVAGAPLLWRTARGMLRGHFATDVVASLAIVAAIALRQPVAGLVIVLMQAGGELLERYAARRATRVLDELEEARPHIAHRITGDEIVDVPVETVRPTELLIVRPGELVPADGVVESGQSAVDASRITGESTPVEVGPGAKLLSGTINGDRPLTLRVTAAAAESQYARIVDLVRSAQASKAPLQRLADRYAIWFTPLTIAICALTYGLSHDWMRVLAVLVVATPCPLILATPVAVVGGISHAARHGIIVRHGGALEALAGVTVAVLDKTGTLTLGRPEVSEVHPAPHWRADNVIRLAAALEQGSGHALARSVVAAAHSRNGSLPPADAVIETPGRGVSGTVGRRRVIVGSRSFVLERSRVQMSDVAALERTGPEAALRAFVVVDDVLAGMIDFGDRLRDNASTTLRRLGAAGIQRTMLLSGDRQQYVTSIANEAGITEARGELLPEDKVNAIVQLSRSGERVLMVGDGVNDAPALSNAAVGIALAAHGRGIASEAADVILLDDDIADVAEAVEIGRKTMRVARQSIVVGLGLSAVAMVFAAAGMIAPVVGAALQEAIDVAVIINALRTSR
jgi:heavy metal translocating P-type ATPase